MQPVQRTCDVLIVGAGVAGGALALALGGAGLRVIVLEQARPDDITAAGFDGRTTAFSFASRQVMTGIGLWPRIAADAEPILDIRITDGAAPVVLGFGHAEIGDEPMGHIVENRLVRRAVFEALAAEANVELRAPARLVDLDRDLSGVRARLDDGAEIRAALVVGADGRFSAVRRGANIRAAEWRYRQTALVCAIAHEKPHRGVAHERFMPDGPFAVLPMTDDEQGRHRSSIVWTEAPRIAEALHAASPERYDAELQDRIGDFVGKVTALPGRWKYPLGVSHADRYVDTRLALIGDAAHAIHPIAGQGLNLGIRDVAALAEVLVEGARLGLDMGDATLLRDYERWRRPDNMQMILATDGLNRLFGTRFGPVQLVRDAGLAAVQRLGPVRRFFIRRAMGLAADAPKLMRGEPL